MRKEHNFLFEEVRIRVYSIISVFPRRAEKSTGPLPSSIGCKSGESQIWIWKMKILNEIRKKKNPNCDRLEEEKFNEIYLFLIFSVHAGLQNAFYSSGWRWIKSLDCVVHCDDDFFMNFSGLGRGSKLVVDRSSRICEICQRINDSKLRGDWSIVRFDGRNGSRSFVEKLGRFFVIFLFLDLEQVSRAQERRFLISPMINESLHEFRD